jgi:hypothetical protein
VVLFVVGVTWGLGVGFAIGAAGTIIAELMTFLCVYIAGARFYAYAQPIPSVFKCAYAEDGAEGH